MWIQIKLKSFFISTYKTYIEQFGIRAPVILFQTFSFAKLSAQKMHYYKAVNLYIKNAGDAHKLVSFFLIQTLLNFCFIKKMYDKTLV